MDESTGKLNELAALLKYAAERAKGIKMDPEGDAALRTISVDLLNLARKIEDLRSYRLTK
jgi:hypothetical protein